MATESFAKTFTIDHRSQDCIEKVMTTHKLTVINCKRTYRDASKTDISRVLAKMLKNNG